jgi:hypothetical protein
MWRNIGFHLAIFVLGLAPIVLAAVAVVVK